MRGLRFSVFELDLDAGELRKDGLLVRLPPQPLKVLTEMALRRGNLVSRDELKRILWPEGVHVEHDRGINFCINQIRTALGDDSDRPRFLKTVPRRGYRFIAPVELIGVDLEPDAAPPVPREKTRRGWFVAGVLAGLIAIGMLAVVYWPWRTAPARRIAILPFEFTPGGDAELAALLHEQLIARMGTVPGERLAVIARASTARYEKKTSLARIAADLRAGIVLDGSIRRQNGTLAITVELVEPKSQSQLWSMSYDRAPAEFAGLAGHIAADLTRFLFGEAVAVARRSPCNRAAEVHLAKAFTFTASQRHWNEALDSFDSAAAADANCVDSLAGVAEVAVRLAMRGAPAAEVLSKAGAAARRAIDLDPSAAAAHNALANVLFWSEWRWKEAELHFRRAIELQPSLALAHHDYAWMMAASGRPDEAIARMERSRELDPVSPQVNIDTGWILYRTRRFSDAIKHCRRVLELDPKMEEARGSLELALVSEGRFREALAEGPGQGVSSTISSQDAEREYRKRAGDRVRKIEQSGTEPKSAFLAALQYVLAGEPQPAMDWIEKAFERRELMAALIDCEPAFDSLRGGPRFQRLVARLGRDRPPEAGR